MRPEERIHNDDPKSPEAIRADIEQTRAQMSTKIDTIQDRLDPDRLKLQAQDAAKEILHDAQDTAKQVINDAGNTLSEYVEEGVQSMTEYVREHREEIGRSVFRTIKENPIPAALIGLGVGWMVMSGTGSDDSQRGSRHINRRRFRDHDSWEDEMLRGRDSGSRIYTPNDAYGEADFDDYDEYRRQNYGSANFRSGSGASQYGGQSFAGSGNLYRGRESDQNRSGQGSSGIGQRMNEMGEQAQNMGERAQHMGEDAVNRAKNAGEDAMDKAQEMGQDLKNRVEETGSNVAHQTQEFTERIRDTGEEWINQAQDMGEDVYRRAEDGIHYMSDQVTRRGGQMGRQIYRRGRRMGYQVHHGMEDNPMTFGLMAFAAGAALAMLLPQTRTENRMIGRYRDEFVDSAREMGENAMEHAQEVYEELRPEVEESVSRFTSEMREVGEHAMEDIREVADKAKESTKSEAKAALNESAGKAGMSGPNNTSEGQGSGSGQQDILKGQWNQLKGDVKQKWGKLTDDDMTRIEGNYDKLIGRIQERYGYSKEQAQKEADQYLKSKGG